MKITIKSRILIIEDQVEALAAMTQFLECAGFCVFGAQTGVDGIQLSEKGEFDLVILEVNLLPKDGFEICARLKQDFRFSRTPIILISNRWNEELRRRALELGAADCIDKPFDGPTFGRRISSHIKPTRSRRGKNFPGP